MILNYITKIIENLKNFSASPRFVFASSRDCDLTDYDATLQYFRMICVN